MFEPSESARNIFEESKKSLMAHTIQGVINHFAKQKITLVVKIQVDKYCVIPDKAYSLLRCDNELAEGRIVANILIHKYANRLMARMCLAHEMAHLLIKLDKYLDSGRVSWPKKGITEKTTKREEEACNLFARDLCYLHDVFNKDDNNRNHHIYFPDGFFNNTGLDTHTPGTWHLRMRLDPENPFNKPI